jgi:hypothetical protein
LVFAPFFGILERNLVNGEVDLVAEDHDRNARNTDLIKEVLLPDC